ncbi:MAG: DedA family protein [Parachlamydiaceae bacterium]|nr:DedA family protein [Parachlamydiaceae bacterium]
MDMLPEMLNVWLLNYGSFALFALLALGIIALPVPEETLLVFTGLLIQKGTLNFFPAFTAAYLGSIVGITGSYLIGHTGGLYVIKKYGSYIGLSEGKMDKAHYWFERYGKWILFIGYFIPGVRHFTGIFAGVTNLEYRHFALFAYSGAFFWVSTFITLGYFFGNYDQELFELVEGNLELILSLGVIAILLFICIKKWKSKPKNG